MPQTTDGLLAAAAAHAAQLPALASDTIDAYATRLDTLACFRDRLRAYRGRRASRRAAHAPFDTAVFARGFGRMPEGLAGAR